MSNRGLVMREGCVSVSLCRRLHGFAVPRNKTP
jgi:hypothetical protein